MLSSFEVILLEVQQFIHFPAEKPMPGEEECYLEWIRAKFRQWCFEPLVPFQDIVHNVSHCCFSGFGLVPHKISFDSVASLRSHELEAERMTERFTGNCFTSNKKLLGTVFEASKDAKTVGLPLLNSFPKDSKAGTLPRPTRAGNHRISPGGCPTQAAPRFPEEKGLVSDLQSVHHWHGKKTTEAPECSRD